MGEFVLLIKAVKNDKNKFNSVIEKMNPLIEKYVRLLYRDEKDDVRAELIMALWEAVSTISYYGNDGQVANYLCQAIKNRYFELYRKSRKVHDHESILEENQDVLERTVCDRNEFDDLLVKLETDKIIDTYQGVKKRIICLIMIENLSDAEIAMRLGLSRQYINRVRRMLQEEIKNRNFDI